jgi:hypothetical protein
MFEVKDGSRILQFNGKLLAESSSWRRGSTRWIEFELYKTENGSSPTALRAHPTA